MGAIWSSFVGLLEQLLLWFSVIAGSMGIGIILFTILARLAILPLTLTSLRSSRKMQELQPLIKELQRKHGKDQKKLQEETVKLYQQYRINPVGGCLPLLLQLPIFFGVYQAVIHLMIPEQHERLSAPVQAAVLNSDTSLLLAQPIFGPLWRFAGERAADISHLVTQPFLGLDLGQAPFGQGGFAGPEYLILPILSVVLQLGQQLMAMPRVQDPQQKAMSQAMLFMPLVFGYIAFTFPAGAVLYWVMSSVIGIVQQYFTSGWGSLANYLKFLPPDRPRQPSLVTAAPVSTLSDGELAHQESGSAAIAPRPGFWDVLRPLTDPESVERAPATSDSTTDRALEEARQPGRQQINPRRPRRRR